MVRSENILKKFSLYFASQKGTAESIADEIEQQSSDHGLMCIKSCISNLQHFEFLESCTVFVGSTTGEGEPPETALKFMKTLKSKYIAGDQIKEFSYTVLGLGDTNYTNFCNFGKTLDKYLSAIGGKRFYGCGWADDGTGLEVVVEPWINGLFTALKDNIRQAEPHMIGDTSVAIPGVDCGVVPLETCAMTSLQENGSQLLKILSLTDVVDLNELKSHPLRICAFEDSTKLTLPAKPLPFLSVSLDGSSCETIMHNIQPSAVSDVLTSHMVSARQLTKTGSKKETLEITLRLENDCDLDYQSGDTFGIVVTNSSEDVDTFLSCMGLMEKQNLCCNITILPDTKKRNASLPSHLAPKACLRSLITKCVDLRAVPKKPFLRALIECASNDQERRRLSELVCKEGMKEYNEHLRLKGVGLLDLLILFPSLKPSLSLVLEHSCKITPRPYSVTSSPLVHPRDVRFVFNVISIPRADSLAYSRQGLCTGHLRKIAQSRISEDLETQLESCSIRKEENCVDLFLRVNKSFRLPADTSLPLIMVGPGTGVAPFVGFLEHRRAQLRADSIEKIGPSYLFFGCRNQEYDFIYEHELLDFLQDGTLTKLFTSFSRHSSDGPKYVQDNLRLHGATISELICERRAVVYVCGDAKNMAKDVFEAFVQVLCDNIECDESQARSRLASMQLEGRYLQDVWS